MEIQQQQTDYQAVWFVTNGKHISMIQDIGKIINAGFQTKIIFISYK